MKYYQNINSYSMTKNFPVLDCIDAFIIDFMGSFIKSGNASKIIIGNETYHWISYAYIIDQLPILHINSIKAISNRVTRMCELGIFKKFFSRKEGSKTYFILGDKYSLLSENPMDKTSVEVVTKISSGSVSTVQSSSHEHSDNSYIKDKYININNTSDIYNTSGSFKELEMSLNETITDDEFSKIDSKHKGNFRKKGSGYVNIYLEKDAWGDPIHKEYRSYASLVNKFSKLVMIKISLGYDIDNYHKYIDNKDYLCYTNINDVRRAAEYLKYSVGFSSNETVSITSQQFKKICVFVNKYKATNFIDKVDSILFGSSGNQYTADSILNLIGGSVEYCSE